VFRVIIRQGKREPYLVFQVEQENRWLGMFEARSKKVILSWDSELGKLHCWGDECTRVQGFMQLDIAGR
jgi:hypothetical protein